MATPLGGSAHPARQPAAPLPQAKQRCVAACAASRTLRGLQSMPVRRDPGMACEAGKAAQTFRRPPARGGSKSIVRDRSPFRSRSPESRSRKKGRRTNLMPFKQALAQRQQQRRKQAGKSDARQGKDVLSAIMGDFGLTKGRAQLKIFLELGMSKANLVKLLHLRRAITNHRPSTIHRKLDFFRNELKMSNEDIKKVLLKFPRILEYRTETTLVPRVEYLVSTGIEMEDMPKILLRAPSVLELSVKNTLEPRLEFLKKDLGLHDNLAKVLVKHPHLMTYNEDSMMERADYLRSIGMDNDDLAKTITSHPQVLHYSVEAMASRVDYFQSIGVEDGNMPKMLSRMPQLLGLNIEVNVAPKFDFLQKRLGGGHKTIVSSPVYLALSLEKRIIPRYNFMKELSPNGIKLPAPMDWFKCSDKVFAGKFAKAPLEDFIAFKEGVITTR